MSQPPNPDRSQQVIASLLASGFPLQTAIARILASTQPFSLVCEEFPWKDASGSVQFADAVAKNGSVTLVVECKKHRAASYTFLHADRSSSLLERHLLRVVYSCSGTREYGIDWNVGSFNFDPPSPDSQFCVVATGTKSSERRLLENDARRLVLATEAYARGDLSGAKENAHFGLTRGYIPVLVTTADLFVAAYDSRAVALGSGEFVGPVPALEPVPWVRFRKAFTIEAKHDYDGRTVVIVNAAHLQEFLTKLTGIDRTPRSIVPIR